MPWIFTVNRLYMKSLISIVLIDAMCLSKKIILRMSVFCFIINSEPIVTPISVLQKVQNSVLVIVGHMLEL
jgi:hypothetical protein